MSRAKECFLEFGGHKGAGGFSLTLEQLSTLEEKLSQALLHVDTECPPDARNSVSIHLSDIGENLWQTVSLFAPFGMGNEKPIFKLNNVSIRSIKQFGKAGEHLELSLENGLKAISFFSSLTTYSLLPTSSSCTLHAHLEKSYFRNRPELRLRIVSINE